MITINVKQVLQEAEERKKNKPVPKIVVISGGYKKDAPAPASPDPEPPEIKEAPDTPEKAELLSKLEADFRQLKIERAKKSNQIYELYKNEASLEDQQRLYNEIKAFKDQLIPLYEKKRYVEEHGVLPEEKQQPKIDDYTLAELQLRKKKLSDLRCKLKKKLQPSAKPARKEKLIEWQQKLAQADREYSMVDMNINQLQSK